MKGKQVSIVLADAMRKVAKDIIKTKFITRKDVKQSHKKFYNIMRKHGIKQGTKSECLDNTITIANYEWTMCKELFLSQVSHQFEIEGLFGDVPKDLHCY